SVGTGAPVGKPGSDLGPFGSSQVAEDESADLLNEVVAVAPEDARPDSNPVVTCRREHATVRTENEVMDDALVPRDDPSGLLRRAGVPDLHGPVVPARGERVLV